MGEHEQRESTHPDEDKEVRSNWTRKPKTNVTSLRESEGSPVTPGGKGTKVHLAKAGEGDREGCG